MGTVFILFDRDIDDIHFIIELLTKMGIPRVYARTKCDLWKVGMMPIAEQLKIDVREIKKYDPSCEKVLEVGYKMYNGIKKELKLA